MWSRRPSPASAGPRTRSRSPTWTLAADHLHTGVPRGEPRRGRRRQRGGLHLLLDRPPAGPGHRRRRRRTGVGGAGPGPVPGPRCVPVPPHQHAACQRAAGEPSPGRGAGRLRPDGGAARHRADGSGDAAGGAGRSPRPRGRAGPGRVLVHERGGCPPRGGHGGPRGSCRIRRAGVAAVVVGARGPRARHRARPGAVLRRAGARRRRGRPCAPRSCRRRAHRSASGAERGAGTGRLRSRPQPASGERVRGPDGNRATEHRGPVGGGGGCGVHDRGRRHAGRGQRHPAPDHDPSPLRLRLRRRVRVGLGVLAVRP